MCMVSYITAIRGQIEEEEYFTLAPESDINVFTLFSTLLLNYFAEIAQLIKSLQIQDLLFRTFTFSITHLK